MKCYSTDVTFHPFPVLKINSQTRLHNDIQVLNAFQKIGQIITTRVMKIQEQSPSFFFLNVIIYHYLVKEMTNKAKSQPTGWENNLRTHTTGRGLISKVHLLERQLAKQTHQV